MELLLNTWSKDIRLINRYAVAALFIGLLAVGIYVFNFYFVEDQSVSDKTADWGAFGDYFGGIIGTVLSFIAMVLLIRSLSLQNEANMALKTQLDNSERTEAIKSFESLFFNLIESQNTLIDRFEIYHFHNGKIAKLLGAEAVVRLEDEIHHMRSLNFNDQQISQMIDHLDEDDRFYNVLRPFSVSVNVISDNLSDDKGFDADVRRFYYATLINFLTFAHLRLVLVSAQFLDVHHANCLKEHVEFNQVLHDLGLSIGQY